MNSRDNSFLRLDPDGPTPSEPDVAGAGRTRAVRYPNLYVWFVFLASMDIMMTWIVLHAGGREANVLAHFFLARWGLPGMVALKFISTIVVVVSCEIIGHKSWGAGRNLARAAVVLNIVPVALAFAQLLVNKYDGGAEPAQAAALWVMPMVGGIT